MTSLAPGSPTKFCPRCGALIDGRATVCPTCNTPQPTSLELSPHAGSEKRILPAVILCMMFGWAGAHRFYSGKIGTAILQLCTLGGLGIWWMIDLIILVIGGFKDSEGRKITEWT